MTIYVVRHLASLALGLMLLAKAGGGVWVLVQSQVVGWGTCTDCDGSGQRNQTVVFTTGPTPVFTTDTPEQVSAKYNAANQ